MGQHYSSICDACGSRSTVNDGGGFAFHLLRCDRCGAGRAIGFEGIGEPHLRYLKGLDVPYGMATAEHDRHVRETFPGEAMTKDEYQAAVEELCGECECGGRFRFDAPPRCPACRSADVRRDPDGQFICYD